MKRPRYSINPARGAFSRAILFCTAALFLFLPHTSFSSTIEELTSSGEAGAVEAQVQLGDAYYSGKGAAKDMQQAFYWYSKAAAQGRAKAQRLLGLMYETGRGTSRNPEKAVYWYRKAAEQGGGTDWSLTNLGVLLEKGEGAEQNYTESVRLFTRAAEQGYARGQTYLGRAYEFGRGVDVDFAKAAEWYRKAAEQGYARAQTNLGALLEAGQDLEQDFEEAVSWYRKAAEQQYPRGQFYLGRMYEQGRGVEKDIAQALFWYEKAANRGYSKAKARIAGLKLPPDAEETKSEPPSPAATVEKQATTEKKTTAAPEKTVEINAETALPASMVAPGLEARAEQGNGHSQNSLALSYLHGRDGYEKNDEKALQWFRLAVENGSIDAHNNLAIMYLNGQGVDKDTGRAFELLQKAAGAGNMAAQSNLGLMYFHGEGIEKDYSQAAFWLMKSAKQGYVSAQYNLAVLYTEGLGVSKNRERAIYWLQQAADQGDAMARKDLAMLVLDQPESTTGNMIQLASDAPVSFRSTEEPDFTTPLVPTVEPDLIAEKAAREHFNVGNQFAKAGQFESAIGEYQKAIALDPSNSNTFENLAISYARTGNFTEAVKSMDRAIQLSPDDAMKYSTMGIIYHADKKLEKALEQYSRSTRLNPGFAEMYYNIAVIYNDLGKAESAYLAALQANILGYAESEELLQELQAGNDKLANLSDNRKRSIHLRHIVTSDPENAGQALELLRQGENFSRLAAEYSRPPFNLNGGYVGLFAPDELMAEIAETVNALAPFDFSPVLETGAGFHIFQKFTVFDDLL